MGSECDLFVVYVRSYELLLRWICGAVFDRTLVPLRFPRLLLGWVPYIMVPKTTKYDHDGKEREDNRLHTALLFLLSTKHISCSQRVSFGEIEKMMRMLLEAPHRVRYGIQAKVGGILWSDELDMVGILLNIGCKEFALVGAIHEYIHDSPDGDSDPPSLSCVLDTRVILFLIRDTPLSWFPWLYLPFFARVLRSGLSCSSSFLSFNAR